MKRIGIAMGGRVFFVSRSALDMDALAFYLESEPALISTIGTCQAADHLPVGAA